MLQFGDFSEPRRRVALRRFCVMCMPLLAGAREVNVTSIPYSRPADVRQFLSSGRPLALLEEHPLMITRLPVTGYSIDLF